MDHQILDNWFAFIVEESGDYGISSYQLSNIHRVISESMNELPDEYQLPLDYVLSKISSKNLREKRSAASILGSFSDNESFCELLLLLNDKDRDTRGRALYSIGLRTLENIPSELLPLLSDEDEKIRLIAVNILAKIKSPTNIRLLLDKTHDIDREVEIEAIQNLKLITDPLIDPETLKKIFEVWIDNPPSLSSTLLMWINKCELAFTEKINLLFDVIASSMVTQMEFNPQIVHGIVGGIKEEQREEILTSYFVDKLIVSDVPARILQIIARLLIELNGGSSLGQKNAAIRIAKKRDSLPDQTPIEIKDKINNLIMLVDPLFIDREEKEKKEKLIGQIQKGFQETYVEVTSQMTERTMREWETTVGQAKLGFSARLYICPFAEKSG